MNRRCAVVVADDLSGANAVGALLARRLFRALSLLAADDMALNVAIREPSPVGGHLENSLPLALIVNTASRGLAPGQAAERVRCALVSTLQRVDALPVVGKRIDSTARGNLGSEIAAALDVLGPRAFAVVVPAHPASGRTVVGGYLLVHGVPVTRTAAAQDPLAPTRCVHLPRLLQAQQPLAVGHVGLDSVLEGTAAIRAAVVAQHQAGRRIMVIDAVSDEDVEALAEALVDVTVSLAVPLVCADSGPLTAATLARLFKRPTPQGAPALDSRETGGCPRAPGPVFVVAGSVTEITAKQLAALEQRFGVALEIVNVSTLVGRSTRQGFRLPCSDSGRYQELERLVSTVLNDWTSPCIGFRSTSGPVDLLPDLLSLEQEALLEGLAEATRLALGRARAQWNTVPSGLYLTGGDVAAAVIRALGAVAIELIDEVLPLAALGRLVGGPYEGLPVVTKGGLVGGEDAAIQCVRHLLSYRRRQC